MTILYNLGRFGPIILIIMSWYLLWENNNLFFYYTIGVFVNSILNLIFKGIIQEPRPLYDYTNIMLAKTHAKQYFFQNGIPFDIFGMPSGHAQSCMFSTTFIFLSLKKTKILYLYLAISLITCYQRVAFDFHTIIQIIVGSIVGCVFGYIVYNFAREKIKGKIKPKMDDLANVYA